ncbi:hypothetical protein Q4517_06870 [Tenacibaculum sp. 1_MG-2023]|uniref:hypothetical protein n=1 Tax=Tenacibaculum sp. 1_MG-2023 TaxID=3062653 RepID=UPI0026E313FB|nr:hypothetical protein [Tenacibaculum sp. 1_MG-2023]MDO6675270.1 hypothetical protein [Tenacibaculum sp. 1_MG-2023]
MYKTLFNINIYHAYFLNEGERTFFELNGGNNGTIPLTDEEKKRIEEQYNISKFLSIQPTKETKKSLKNHRLLLRNHKKGIRIVSETLEVIAEEGNQEVKRYSPIITLSDSLTLTFYLKVHHPYFENYSNIIEKKEQQLYYLSNKSSSAINLFETISEVKKWSSFLISDSETRKLLHQIESEKEFDTTTPNLVTIANIEVSELDVIESKITNAIPLTKEEEKVIDTINSFVRRIKNSGVIGIVQIQISGDNNTSLTEEVLVKNEQTELFDVPKQCLLEEFPQFAICIENRSTFWRYTKRSENLVMTTSEEKPLTFNGRVEIDKQDVSPQPQDDYYFPNPTPESIKKESQDYYSEVFI